ncbi:MAG: DAPG hydrolase family protein [Mycobacterium sp.]
MIPVTYYPVKTQVQLARNRTRVQRKPYAHFFREDLVLDEAVLPGLKAPMNPAHALSVGDGINRLLDPGYHHVETGYCVLHDGTVYVASLTKFPRASAEMFRWWFWWHSVEAERYTLWFPYNHVSAIAQNREVLVAPALQDWQRYIGNTHTISEYVGPDLSKLYIQFVDPSEFGIDTAALPAANVHAHACAHVFLQKPHIRVATMVHLVRDTDGGFEVRSRYWFADHLQLQLGGRSLDVTTPLRRTGIAQRLSGARAGYELLLHDQIEFTHLAGILPDLYAEFGPGKNSSDL